MIRSLLLWSLLAVWFVFGVIQAQTLEPPGNSFLINSPWAMAHRGPAMQASSPWRGPESTAPTVQIRYFQNDAGKAFGTSPFHVLSSTKYAGKPEARTIWGATLTYLYKYEIDGETFRFADSFRLNSLPFWVGWNLFGLSGDRIVVPNPSGLRLGEHRQSPCHGRHPSLLVFTDGPTAGSAIRCVSKFELSPVVIEAACGWRRSTIGTAGVLNGVLSTGEIAVILSRDIGWGTAKRQEIYVAIIDNALRRIKACEFVDDSKATNLFPVEQPSAQESILYIATENGLVAMSYDASNNQLLRLGRTNIPLRRRTGTTPTLMGFRGEDRFAILIDAKCAVTSVFSGKIACAGEDTGPSRLVAVRRGTGMTEIITVNLPDFIETVENSPAVRGYDIVVANYSGYSPDGVKDGKRDFAKGIVKLSWNPSLSEFQTDWANPNIQISGVPTISEPSNLVYGSGADEADGFSYFYGLRLNDDGNGSGGEVVIKQRLGPATDTRRGAKDGLFDAGNNTLVNDDGSVIWPAGNALVRVKD